MGSTPKHSGYEEMQDTPWITQARKIADIGGTGVLSNYNKTNVFDEATRNSLNAYNNSIYDRALGDAEKAYTNTMNKYNAKNYNQFGTLNATAPAFVTDNYQRQFQRQMDDLAYNKAVNYENLINNELQRRYNTLNMFGNLYGYGQTPYKQDISNWNIRNTNRDINYMNDQAKQQSGFKFGSLIGGGLGALTGNPYMAIAGANIGGGLGWQI